MVGRQTSLQRFHTAQNEGKKYRSGISEYEIAKKELQAGKKSSHWIWYILPQLKALGYSSTSKFYGLKNFSEACLYLKDPILFQNYCEIVHIIAAQLRKKIPVETLMGWDIDAKKLSSSVTLFRTVAAYLATQSDPDLPDFSPLINTCDDILRITAEQGYGPCKKTLVQPSVANPVFDENDAVQDDDTATVSASRPAAAKVSLQFNYIPIPPPRSGTAKDKANRLNHPLSSQPKPIPTAKKLEVTVANSVEKPIVVITFDDAKSKISALLPKISDTTVQLKTHDILKQLRKLHRISSAEDKAILFDIAKTTIDLLESTTPSARREALQHYKELAYQAHGRVSGRWKLLGGAMMVLGAAVALCGCVVVAGVPPLGVTLIGAGGLAILSGPQFFNPKGLSKEMHEFTQVYSIRPTKK